MCREWEHHFPLNISSRYTERNFQNVKQIKLFDVIVRDQKKKTILGARENEFIHCFTIKSPHETIKMSIQ